MSNLKNKCCCREIKMIVPDCSAAGFLVIFSTRAARRAMGVKTHKRAVNITEITVYAMHILSKWCLSHYTPPPPDLDYRTDLPIGQDSSTDEPLDLLTELRNSLQAINNTPVFNRFYFTSHGPRENGSSCYCSSQGCVASLRSPRTSGHANIAQNFIRNEGILKQRQMKAFQQHILLKVSDHRILLPNPFRLRPKELKKK